MQTDITVARAPSARFAVTGTDTSVGKTVISCAMIAAMRASGFRVAPMKPVGNGGYGDADLLLAASGAQYSRQLVCPYAFEDAVAPLVAARRARVPIQIDVLDTCFAELSASSDCMVVEGSGGLLVPITESDNFATLFRRWNLPLVIVASNRRGVINHALLTVNAALSHGLDVRAVVLNSASNVRPGTAERTNDAVLKELLRNIPVVVFPHTSAPTDNNRLAILARELTSHATIRRPA